MKRQLFRIILAAIALSMGVWLMSCGSSPQNTTNTTNTAETSSVAPATTSDPCGVPAADLRQAIEDAVKDAVKADNDLTKHNHNNNANVDREKPYLRYQVIEKTTGTLKDVYVLFEGRISGKDVMEDVVKSIEKHVKKKCAYRIFFVPKGTLPMSTEQQQEFRDTGGFEWNACEHPQVACPGGVCKDDCNVAIRNVNRTPSPNANVNTNGTVNRP